MQFDIHHTATVPGVYAIRTPDGRAYVGQSEDIRARFIHHRHLASKRRHKRSEFNGQELTCQILAVEPNPARRLELEQHWIAELEVQCDVTHLGSRRGRLTPDQVRAIRALQPKYGERVLERAAEQLGLTTQAVYAIRKRRSYRNIQ